jgi:hypothetical protein
VGKIIEVTKKGAGAVSIAAASYRVVRLALTNEGRVGKVVVKQLDASGESGGTAVAFAADLLSSAVGMAVDADIANATALPADLDLYKIMPQITATAGNAAVVYTPAAGGDGFLFKNNEGPAPSYLDRYIYLLIRPTAAATLTKWKFSIAVWHDLG